ncbi:sarcosine oxidase subunit gamma [Meridianimarinicoccus roseus]|jgi:sarcosine oxidase subunit gamma|uniref:Sarcosine oxidase subunit gamma n=1 Tax=Meridianimarinicoccus roseus TaxID=2072018 RepID=A0A2V2LHV5_9RHOB|nr:sarcosine oxidase subunit gamma family protein [Meridianimarinicoccus roseus]PWR04512.1 sarcosine oxidase subunit gamma [Meridianimarinicoccus roseus]
MTVLPTNFVPEPLATSAAATVTLLAPTARFSLRVWPEDRARLSAALTLELPVTIGQRARGTAPDGTEALCVGPDEWILVAPDGAGPAIEAACGDAYCDAPHSLVALPDREVSVRIEGPKAAELLTLGCPRDLDALIAGQGRRTVFDGVSVILWRDAAQEFRLDVWRSFAPHVLALLETGCRELALD